MRFAAIAASDCRIELFRIDDAGRLEARSFSPALRQWSGWEVQPFDGDAAGVAAISGWPEHIEVFVIDSRGAVWNRWWWEDRGWTPEAGFNALGRPFDKPILGFAAFNAGDGYFNVFVAAADGEIVVLPHQPLGTHATWRRQTAGALGDGWWQAFDDDSAMAYRLPL